ncbi:ATP-binding cassette sub-family F member 3-like isoform X1 [Varroa jacobsoni]|uniref:ABC transporter domain-containing protein n=2 Tax=Varroa TaxID=62624 RepID=A0A7M7KNF5_VARDE|nr:ATP-binding cassette sub-family F member 3-like [Varroa destructor]XP_022686917.1 ATP-binding cassette sub-family F member 3-like isoform X1 [Varroa jacobsoni]
MSTPVQDVLKKQFPNIDSDLFEYLTGVLSSDDLGSVEDVQEACGEMLAELIRSHREVHQKTEEEAVRSVCEDLFQAIGGGGGPNHGNEINGSGNSPRLLQLSSPVHLASTLGQATETRHDDTASIWLAQKHNVTTVDQRKLEKAEAKIRAKQERREGCDVPSALLTATLQTNKEATATQALSRKGQHSEASSKSRDIRIENFDVNIGDKSLLQNATLALTFGRRFGLVGRNGIGKSTLLKMISTRQLCLPAHVTVLHVEQEVVGDGTKALDSVLECDEERQRLLAEEKKLSSSGTNDARLSEIYARLQEIDAESAPARASVILAGLGFTPEMQKKATREFSGGWRMRIALARALFTKPDLLLLDEPTNMLDMKAIIWLENYLKGWESTLLVVSHDRQFLDEVPTDIIHFHNSILESYRGNYTDFVKTAADRLLSQQREYEAQMTHRKHVQVFIDKFRYNANRAVLVQSKIKMLEKLPELKPVQKEAPVVLRFPEPEALFPILLQLDGVHYSYGEGQRTVLTNVDLSASMQSRICIVGDNGAGKTTLLKLVNGDYEPTKGVRQAHRNLVIGYFSQHHVDGLDMDVSSVELLARRFPGKTSEHYRSQLGQFGISGELALQPIATLSGGQKSRVAFAVLAMSVPHLLVLDEPTNHLDIESIDALAKCLQVFKGGVILVSHDERLVKSVCKELWVCAGGTVTSIEGGFEEYRSRVQRELEAQ